MVGVATDERETPGRTEIEDRPERKDVASCVAGSALHLLRRHVTWGAEDLTRDRERVRVDHVGDAEVGELHATIFVNQHVLRLHVTVNDALVMRLRERVSELKCDADRDFGGHFFVSRTKSFSVGPVRSSAAMYVSSDPSPL